MSEQIKIAFEKFFPRPLAFADKAHELEMMSKWNDAKITWETSLESATAEANKRIAELEGDNKIYAECNAELKAEYIQLNNTSTSNAMALMTLTLLNTQLQASNNHLREALERIKQNKYAGISTASLPPIDQRALWAEQALSSTPAESLQAHDDELIEKCAKVCNDMLERRGVTFDHKFMADTCAYAIRALKEVK